eukprot:m.232740 g.232740  ORF g.232740 m.232740 type:complete len:69 (-) comp13903_c0_seq14:1276-1482(-)
MSIMSHTHTRLLSMLSIDFCSKTLRTTSKEGRLFGSYSAHSKYKSLKNFGATMVESRQTNGYTMGEKQ